MASGGPDLIARDAALAVLDRQLREAGKGGASFVLISGPSGVGKTALLQALVARHTGPVLRAAAAGWETHRPYAVLGQLLPHDRPPTDPIEAADRLVQYVVGPGARQVDGEHPMLIAVDDAHWADEESVQSLVSAVRHHRDARLVVVATAASGDPGVPAATLDLLHRVALPTITLEPFTAAEVGELAAAQGVSVHPAMAERLCRHTGGTARHTVQLLAELPRETWSRYDPDLPAPAAVAARVRETLTACPAAARRLIEATAALGPDTAVRDAAVLADLHSGEEATVLAVLDDACTTGLVRLASRGPTEVAPANPIVRAAVLAEMGPAAAADLRRRAADIVDDPVRRMRLLVAASPVPDADAAHRLDSLATDRAAAGAWAEAASLLRDAGRLTQDRLLRESRLTRAVDALIGAGDAFGAAALVPEIESLRETPLRDAVLGYLAIVRGRAAEADTHLARAWNLVNTERDPDVAALICQRNVLHALAHCRPRDLVSWADRAIALVGADAPAGLEAAAIRGLGLAADGRTDEALTGYTSLAGRIRHGAQVQRITMAQGWLHLTIDAVDDARTELASAVPTTFFGGSTRISLWARALLARAQFVTGEWDEALRTVREARELIDRTGIVLTGPLTEWTAAAVHAARGEWDGAAAAVRRADAMPQEYAIMRVPGLLARAHLAEARADSAGVLHVLRPLAQPWAQALADDTGLWSWADRYAHALILEGRLAEADGFLTRHERLALDRGLLAERARLAAARGRLLGAQGELSQARAAFGESVELLEGLPLRYDRARVNFAYAQILWRAGKRREADTVFGTARELFVALGARPYVERCERKLTGGTTPGSRSGREIDALTPQETAVSQLVARGLSNRDVAAELFLSTKTVQYHLTRVYAKLGIRSRAELAALHDSTHSDADSRDRTT